MKNTFSIPIPAYLLACLRYVLCLGLFFTSVGAAYASHASGADITYTCLDPATNSYQITVRFYRSCAPGAISPSAPSLDITGAAGCTGVTTPVTTALVSVRDVSQLCDLSTSQCAGGANPGTEEWLYRATVTLPAGCSQWTVAYESGSRNTNITNLQNPGSADWYYSTTINTANAPCNSSPQFSNIPVIYTCAGQQTFYNHGTTDPNGDSLSFRLVAPRNTATTGIGFVAGLSVATPLFIAPATTFVLNPTTGQLTFTPAAGQAQTAIVAMIVSEFRNGVKIGETLRELQVVVLTSCTNSPPAVTSINTNSGVIVGTNISVCAGGSVVITAIITDPNVTNILTITSNISTAVAGSTFSTVGSNPVTVTFNIPTTNVATGTYPFTISARDNACPISSFQIFGYNLILSNLVASANQYYKCPNVLDNIQLFANGLGGASALGTYSWSPATNLSNPNIYNPIASIVEPDTFVVTYVEGVCTQRDTVRITAPYPATINPIPDAIICNGNTAQLTATVASSSPRSFNGVVPVTAPVAATTDVLLNVTGIAPNAVLDSSIASVCFSLNMGGLSRTTLLNIYLISPSGQILELTTGNGGGPIPPQTSFSNLCFSPRATVAVNSFGTATIPSGTYRPEGTWSNLVGGLANGTWRLRIQHTGTSAGGASAATVSNFTMTFNDLSAATFNWSPNSFISCLTCPNPVVGPSTNTTYTVIAQNLFGCRDTATANVIVSTSLPSTTLSCASVTFSSVRFAWQAVSGVAGYQLIVDGGTPFTVSPATLNYTQAGVASGQCVTLAVVPVSGNSCGNGPSASLQCCALSCAGGAVVGSLSGINNPTCAGTNNGSITAAGSGTTTATPFIYTWSNAQTTATATGLGAGVHCVTISDQNGCANVLCATLTVPSAMSLTTASLPVTCNGLSNGTASVTATGGSGTIGFVWSNAQTNATQTGLPAGNYTVTATDANGCSMTASTTISQPSALGISTTVVSAHNGFSISCAGGGDGIATVLGSGGSGSYGYMWTNGGTAATQTGLSAGVHCVTITDANACTISQCVTLTEPTAVSVSANPTAVTCFGGNNGSASAVGTGGVGGYVFLWNDANNQTTGTATGLTAGTYTVTATDLNGCVANISTTITQPGASIQTNASSTPALCAGAGSGTATVSITGGTSPFAVLWSSNASGQTTNTATGLTAGNYSVTATDNLGCSASSTITVAAANGLSLIMSNTNATCAGYSNGTATASATGGAGGYLYAWANGQTTATATGLAAGSICVTVTDANGCPINDCATISQPQGMGNLQYAVQGVSCFGSADGRATVSFTGGVFPFSYVWDNNTNGATGTGFSPGAHSVTITDANNCTVTGSTNIPQPAQLQVSATADSVLCRFGTTGRTLATATGGTFPYAYLWSNGQNTALNDNLTANTYTVTVTDLNNCTATATTIVGQPASAVLANMTSVSQASCNGLANGSATVNGTGGTPNYTYLWSNGQTMATASGLSAGAYTVTLTDQRGCSATANTNISQPTALVATASVFSNYNGADVSCTNSNDGIARVIVSGGAGGYGYRWSSIPAQLTPVASGLLPGNYTVTVTDLSGCSVTRTVTLRNPVQLAATFSQVNVFCKGQNTGQIVVNATAGTGTLGINGYEYAIFGANQQGNVYSAVNQWFGLVAGTYTVIVRDGNNCQIPVSIQITEPSALSISTQSTAVLCNGTGTGTSATTITGGTSPYTYSWSDGQTSRIATGLVTGGYSVTATDANGCDIAAQVVITEPAALAVSISVNGVSCNGGNDGLAIAQPTGGIAPYRYRWSNGQTAQTGTNFIAGTHAITLTDANNCVLVSSFTVTEPLGLVSSITVQNLSCAASANGTATALAQGGTAPYTYAWINGQTTQIATGLNASVQRVVITDALGCQTQAQTTLTQPSVLSAQITAQTATLCANSADGTATVSPNGGTSGYTYLWSNGQTTAQATGLAANQSYTVTVTDANGCNTSISTTIPNPSALAITNTTHTDVLCRGGATGRATVFVSGGTLPYTYAWSNGQNSPVATGLAANLYSVTISDANGCATTTQVSIAQPTQALSMFVNTNPTLCAGGSTGQAVAVPGGGTPLAGNTYRYLWSNGQTTRGISGLLSGAYTVTVTDANGCTITNGGQVTDGGSSQVQAQVLQNPTCLGGNEGRATASGSSSNGGNVSYLWSTGQTIQTITGLTAGVYTVVVTDTTNCQATASVTVTDGISISASAVVNNVSCFGLADGDLQVTSSPAGVIYEWDNQFVATNGNLTDLAAGEYTVTISIAQGCRQDFTFTVTEPQSITLATAQTRAITCYDGNNGAANVSVTGGSPAYSYLWSNGVQTDAIDSISAGGYSVVVTDANGCTATSTIAIVEPAELIVTVTSTGLLCSNSQNGQIAVGATGGTLNLGLYEYGISTDSTPVSLWQTGNLFPNLSAGDFYVQVRDINGCTDTAQINVKAALPFFITSATADTTIQFLDSLQLAVGLNDTTNNTVSSNWILLGANGDTLASNKYLLWIAPQDAGQYLFRATNQNGCIVDTTINIGVLKNRFANAPTGFTPNNDGTNDKFFIQAANESKIEKILTFRVYDRWGELVHEALDVMPNDDSKGWDGTFKGKEMNAGVFAWYAEVKYKDGFIQTIKGDVTLLK